jgi:hypothetical protein
MSFSAVDLLKKNKEEEQRTKNSSSVGIEKIETLLLRTTALQVLKSCQ